MNINDVKAGIQEWNDNLDNATLMSKLYDIKALNFDLGNVILMSTDLHVYPAIDKNSDIQFYLISSTFDNKEQSNIIDYIVQASPEPQINYGSIPGIVAKSRIENWANHFTEWLDDSIAQSSMFQGFVVPGDDLNETNFTIYFGLRPDDASTGIDYFADLILISASNKVYEDTVMPVPPFGLNPGSAKNLFSLLP